jgi:PAS domain S-box-containing protein
MANKREPNARARSGRAVRRRRGPPLAPNATPPPAREPDERSAVRVAELERGLQHYRNLFDNAPIPYVTLDPLGVIVDANLTYADLVKRPQQALVHRPLVRMLAENDRTAFYHHMRRCRRETSARTEVHLEASDGSVPVEIDSHLAPKSDDQTLRFHTAIIDLRERHEAEKARITADRDRVSAEEREQKAHALNEAKDRFLAELRTPLTPIMVAVTKLSNETHLPGDLRSTIEMIRRNLEVEVRLIDDLLDVSRLGRRRPQLQLQPVDGNAAIHEVARELEQEFRAKDVAFSLRLDARDDRILADPLRLHQILWNVVSNALQNTPCEGSVLVTTSNMDRDVRIVVRDNGVGIAVDQLDDIFRPFFREDGKRGSGLGLGLAIAKGLVEAHEGRISAFSEGKGKGAAFAIELPVLEPGSAPAMPSDADERPPVISAGRRRILLVEDHADTREALQMFLEMKGYDVRLAQDVTSALEAASEPFDVLVCDIGLPDGSGYDVIRTILAARPAKAIALTGYGAPQDLQLAKAAGFADHLTKPVGGDKLVHTIESLFAT